MRMRVALALGLSSLGLMGLVATASLAAPKVSIEKGKRVIDLGEGEIFGDLKRPQLRWIDSSAAMREILPKIHARKFAQLEAELLKPMDRAQWRARLKVVGGRK